MTLTKWITVAVCIFAVSGVIEIFKVQSLENVLLGFYIGCIPLAFVMGFTQLEFSELLDVEFGELQDLIDQAYAECSAEEILDYYDDLVSWQKFIDKHSKPDITPAWKKLYILRISEQIKKDIKCLIK